MLDNCGDTDYCEERQLNKKGKLPVLNNRLHKTNEDLSHNMSPTLAGGRKNSQEEKKDTTEN